MSDSEMISKHTAFKALKYEVNILTLQNSQAYSVLQAIRHHLKCFL